MNRANPGWMHPRSFLFEIVILNEVKDPCISSLFFLSTAGKPDSDLKIDQNKDPKVYPLEALIRAVLQGQVRSLHSQKLLPDARRMSATSTAAPMPIAHALLVIMGRACFRRALDQSVAEGKGTHLSGYRLVRSGPRKCEKVRGKSSCECHS
jgi:hypothetical protein